LYVVAAQSIMLDKLPHFAYFAKHGGVEDREKGVEDALRGG